MTELHVGPVHWGGQMHWKELPTGMHWPPFAQGLGEHGFIGWLLMPMGKSHVRPVRFGGHLHIKLPRPSDTQTPLFKHFLFGIKSFKKKHTIFKN